MHQIKKLTLVTLLFSLPLLALNGCSKNEPQAASVRGGDNAAKQPPKQVKVTEASEHFITRNVEAPGTLAADEQATVSFKGRWPLG
jgi:multidrug efflux pump subunit AcrA (membrane-fusion protein)